LWILGDIVGLPFFAAQLIQMIREDEADAKVIDAELDARDAARAGKEAAQTATVAADGGGGTVRDVPDDRPWWESDPRFAERFQAIDDGGD
jgi:hypothetical protein